MVDYDNCGAVSGMKERQGKPNSSRETCPIAALFITDPTLLDLCSNTGRRGGNPAANCLSYGTAVPPHITVVILEENFRNAFMISSVFPAVERRTDAMNVM
jgi:hypothetical protein